MLIPTLMQISSTFLGPLLQLCSINSGTNKGEVGRLQNVAGDGFPTQVVPTSLSLKVGPQLTSSDRPACCPISIANYRARLRAVRSLVASSAHSILIARPSIWIELIHLGAIALVNRVLTSAVTFIGGARRQALALVRTSVDTQINGPVWLSQIDLR